MDFDGFSVNLLFMLEICADLGVDEGELEKDLFRGLLVRKVQICRF